jgi:hypothetical protein
LASKIASRLSDRASDGFHGTIYDFRPGEGLGRAAEAAQFYGIDFP